MAMLCRPRNRNIINVYTATENETLENIAKKFGTDVKTLQKLNYFNNDTKLKKGDQIQLPVEIYALVDDIYNLA